MSMFWAGQISRAIDRAADQASSSAGSSAGSSAARANTNVRYLQKDVERLTMICEAMWSMLRDKLGVDDEELMARIAELDLSDGEADGRKEVSGPAMCPKCSRPNSRRHDFCIYCGTLIRTTPFG